MDYLLILVLLAFLYLVPELLRRNRQPRRHEYPEIPLPAPRPRPRPANVEDAGAYQAPVLPPVRALEFVMPPVVNMGNPLEEPSTWRGKFDSAALINGIIFAEILRPPRAYRPLSMLPSIRYSQEDKQKL